MPDPVEGLADVTENDANFFAFVQGPAKGVIEINKLINNGISRNKVGLKRNDDIVFKQKVVHMFVDNLFKSLAKRA